MTHRWPHAFARLLTLALMLPSASPASPAPVAFASGLSQEQRDDIVWHSNPASPERMAERLEEAAKKYQEYAPIPRGVFYDIGFPRSNEEYRRLGGHAVLLITAVSQERDELPIAQVYVKDGSRQIELKLIRAVLSKDSSASSKVTKTFGAYRSDGLYLLPVYLHMQPMDLLVDFAKNKQGLKAAEFGPSVSAEVPKLEVDTAVTVPSDETLESFIRREFPGFATK